MTCPYVYFYIYLYSIFTYSLFGLYLVLLHFLCKKRRLVKEERERLRNAIGKKQY